MSDATRNRVLRAVRLLPDAVRVGRGGVEEESVKSEEPGPEQAERAGESEEKRALAAADAEIRKLKSQLREREQALAEERDAHKAARDEMQKLRADLDAERKELYAKLDAEKAAALDAASKKGYDEGLSRGYDDGINKAEAAKQAEYEARFSDALSLLDKIAAELQAAREKLAEAHAPEMIRLWEMMLERMLLAKVSLDPEVVERQVLNILKRISDRERVMVYLNPGDTEMIESGKEALIDTIRGVKIFELLSDDYVERGSCLIETNLGIYDARWRTQLEQIEGEVSALLMEVVLSNEEQLASGGGAA